MPLDAIGLQHLSIPAIIMAGGVAWKFVAWRVGVDAELGNMRARVRELADRSTASGRAHDQIIHDIADLREATMSRLAVIEHKLDIH